MAFPITGIITTEHMIFILDGKSIRNSKRVNHLLQQVHLIPTFYAGFKVFFEFSGNLIVNIIIPPLIQKRDLL